MTSMILVFVSSAEDLGMPELRIKGHLPYCSSSSNLNDCIVHLSISRKLYTQLIDLNDGESYLNWASMVY